MKLTGSGMPNPPEKMIQNNAPMSPNQRLGQKPINNQKDTQSPVQGETKIPNPPQDSAQTGKFPGSFDPSQVYLCTSRADQPSQVELCAARPDKPTAIFQCRFEVEKPSLEESLKPRQPQQNGLQQPENKPSARDLQRPDDKPSARDFQRPDGKPELRIEGPVNIYQCKKPIPKPGQEQPETIQKCVSPMPEFSPAPDMYKCAFKPPMK